MLTLVPRRLRVLIVDPSVVVRRAIGRALQEAPGIEVCGAAPDGPTALRRCRALSPSLVISGALTGPGGGLDALASLARLAPVVLFDPAAVPGSELASRSTAAGVGGYAPRPPRTEHIPAAVTSAVLPLIRRLCDRAPAPPATGRIEVVAIGSSTGGPEALATVLGDLPEALPVPVIISQHLPLGFASRLARVLAGRACFPVREAVDRLHLEPGCAWVAPGGFHLGLTRTARGARVALQSGGALGTGRPSVDVMLRAAAECYGSGVLAVVLTGMGQDGLRGCEAVARRGGRVLAQDRASSVVWGMPGFVAQAGLAEDVVPLGRLADAIHERVAAGRTAQHGDGAPRVRAR